MRKVYQYDGINSFKVYYYFGRLKGDTHLYISQENYDAMSIPKKIKTQLPRFPRWLRSTLRKMFYMPQTTKS